MAAVQPLRREDHEGESRGPRGVQGQRRQERPVRGSTMSGNGKPGKVLVIGGGISGMTAAIEASEAGCEVVLVEKNPYVGGRVAQFNQYFPKLCQSVLRKDNPKTTNPVERGIGEFEERYLLTKGFTSFYYTQFFIKAYQIYYRLRKISFGRFSGKSRLEVKGNPLGKLSFTDYLTPTFF